jgi:hypothetical protein
MCTYIYIYVYMWLCVLHNIYESIKEVTECRGLYLRHRQRADVHTKKSLSRGLDKIYYHRCRVIWAQSCQNAGTSSRNFRMSVWNELCVTGKKNCVQTRDGDPSLHRWRTFTAVIFLDETCDEWLNDRSVCWPYVSWGALSFIIPGERVASGVIGISDMTWYIYKYNYLLAQESYQFVLHVVLTDGRCSHKQDVESFYHVSFNQNGVPHVKIVNKME